MPRLIDADKLEDEIVFNKLPHSVWELDAILTSIVSGQDTVDAIPVEWLKKWAEDNSNGEWSVEYRTVFNGILKDWEKENGLL